MKIFVSDGAVLVGSDAIRHINCKTSDWTVHLDPQTYYGKFEVVPAFIDSRCCAFEQTTKCGPTDVEWLSCFCPIVVRSVFYFVYYRLMSMTASIVNLACLLPLFLLCFLASLVIIFKMGRLK